MFSTQMTIHTEGFKMDELIKKAIKIQKARIAKNQPGIAAHIKRLIHTDKLVINTDNCPGGIPFLTPKQSIQNMIKTAKNHGVKFETDYIDIYIRNKLCSTIGTANKYLTQIINNKEIK
jgi:hypothetical protein